MPKRQSKIDKEKAHNTIYVGHHCTQTDTNNRQTTSGKDEPNVVFVWTSSRTPQHGTQNVKKHNRITQKTKKMSNTELNKKYRG
jgi:hypothetical protein